LLGTKTAWSIVDGWSLIVEITPESVCWVAFCPWLPSVCRASQTRAAMMISGKSALRKNRFN
jgi:predicted RNase H-like HicB family nuclease